jgi:hypothetical protein
MDKLFIYFIILLLGIGKGYGQANSTDFRGKDTTIVGVILDTDSIFLNNNYSRLGARYYYGVHHFKLGVIDISDSVIEDTIIVAYVFNFRSDLRNYFNDFDLKVHRCYIFDLAQFLPCKSDFPRIEGRCGANYEFFPVSNRLITHYSKIYRVINSSKWNGSFKK